MTGSWPELLSTALVGTRRRSLPAVTDADALGAVLSAVDVADPATALLDRAAIHTTHRRAGLTASAAAGPVVEAPADGRRFVPSAAAARIATLLADSGDRGLVGEWLALANARDL